MLMDQADVAVWLRLPFHIVYWRLLRHTIRDLLTTKPIWEGNTLAESRTQTFVTQDSILLWCINHWKPHIRGLIAALDTTPEYVTILFLRSSRAVNDFVNQLPQINHASSDG